MTARHNLVALGLLELGNTLALANPHRLDDSLSHTVPPNVQMQWLPMVRGQSASGMEAWVRVNIRIDTREWVGRSGRIYMDGEVRTPGLQALNDIPMTLPEALGRAGGFTATADRSAIAITRNGSTTTVNLAQLTERGVSPTGILLGNGDLVRVLGREEAKVFVMGEVLRPSTQTLRNGRLTLNEALGDSGGVSPVSGDPRQIFVIRAANRAQPEIYHLDAHSPTAYALAEGFELQARDVVYVDPVPLVRWNRVISLILPSAAVVNNTSSAFN
jgi:polysaccharide export outer membrane protein